MWIRLSQGRAVGSPLAAENGRALLPSVSLPQMPSPAELAPFGFGLFEFSAKPVAGPLEVIEEQAPQQGSDGIWRQCWVVRPMDPKERQLAHSRQCTLVRHERNRRLRACDWTQLADAAERLGDPKGWLTYRQALRDVPCQQGFPWEVNWPAPPQEIGD